jgi:hypothetical protein
VLPGPAWAGAAPHPPGAGGRARTGPAVDDEREQVLPDSRHRRRHGDVAAPRSDRDRPVGVDHQRSATAHQRPDHPVLGVVAAMGVGHLEATVESRDQGAGRRRRDRRGVLVRAASRGHRP